MGTVLDVLSSSYDYVLIDAPSVLAVTDAAVLSRWTSGTILVVGANRVSEPELLAAFDALEAVGTTPLGVVLSMVPLRGPDALVRDGGFVGASRPAPRVTRSIDVKTINASRSTSPDSEPAPADTPTQQRVTW
jgi:hypothetical protein